jgi:hypothetical protein
VLVEREGGERGGRGRKERKVRRTNSNARFSNWIEVEEDGEEEVNVRSSGP